jgi:hypothetical protein
MYNHLFTSTLSNDYCDVVRWRRQNWERLHKIWASKAPSITLLHLFCLLYVYFTLEN